MKRTVALLTTLFLLAIAGNAAIGKEEGIVDCFDYYRFGSVQADIGSEISTPSAGSVMHFDARITNSNYYPVVNGSLYVKIFRKEEDLGKAHANGHHVVDQFFGIEGISIDPGGFTNAGFDWKVPTYSIPGKYYAATFFTTEKKFNLLGLAFTDDIVGNIFEFEVKNEQQVGVYFLKDTVKIGDLKEDFNYNFAAFTPKVPAKGTIIVQTELANKTQVRQDTQVEWELYRWDMLSEENLISRTSEKISLMPGEKKKLYYSTDDTDFPVYLVVARAKYNDAQSILNVRFVREGIDRPRLNFPSLLRFPLAGSEPNSVFACMHNSGTDKLVQGARVELELVDGNNKRVHFYSSDLNITGSMMAVKTDFVPYSTADKARLLARLYLQGKLIDSAEIDYDCKKLSASSCPAVQKPAPALAPKDIALDYTSLAVLALAAVVFVSSCFLLLKKKMKMMHLFFMVLVSCGLLFLSADVQAKSVQWNWTSPDTYDYYWNRFGYDGYEKALVAPNVTITYNVQVTNKATGTAINDFASVPVGTVLVFEAVPSKDTDISWFGTGYSQDSPYGHFGDPDIPPVVSCRNEDFVGKDTLEDNLGRSEGTIDVYLPLIVREPKKALNIGGTARLLCKDIGPFAKECEIKSKGTITALFSFGQTNGKFYYRYYDYRDEEIYGVRLSPGCYGNNIPLRRYTGRKSDCDVVCYFTDSVEDDDFVLEVPEQTVSYTINAVNQNNAPEKPQISGPKTGLTDIKYRYMFRSQDMDGDAIRYGIDTDNDGTVNEWLPTAGHVVSGTEKDKELKWILPGAKTFGVIAQDSSGANSGWAEYSVEIKDRLRADAGPPYTSQAGVAFAMHGSATGGSGKYIKWNWSFENNTADCLVKKDADTARPQISCAQQGVAKVILEIMDSEGMSASDASSVVAIAAPQCIAKAGSGSIKTKEPVTVTVHYSGFVQNPMENQNARLDCGTTIVDLKCVPAGNIAPFSGICNAECTYSTARTNTPVAEIKTQNQSASCSTGQVNVGYPPIEAKINGPYTTIPDQKLVLAKTTVSGGSGTYTDYLWKFLDNSADCKIFEQSNTQKPQTICKKQGTSNIKLTVRDSAGAEGSDTSNITSMQNNPPTCTITAINVDDAAQKAEFLITASDDRGIATNNIEYGDDVLENLSISGNITKSHIYSTIGQFAFEPKVTVTDRYGSRGTCTTKITFVPIDVSVTPCSGVCENGLVCSGGNEATGICSDGKICCMPFGKKNSVSIDVSLNKERFKVGQDNEIVASFRIVRYDNSVDKAGYEIKIRKNGGKYIKVKSGTASFTGALKEATINLTDAEKKDFEISPLGKLGPGIYVVTGIITDDIKDETIKHDNVDSETAFVWEYKEAVPETNIVLALIAAIVAVLVIANA